MTAFTRLLNDSNDLPHVPGARVVAAFKGGSPDVEASLVGGTHLGASI